MEKLIRDKVHSIPNPEYPNMQTRKVADIGENIVLLIAKIIEERNEFQIADSMEGQCKEAADLFEVIDSIILLGLIYPALQYPYMQYAIVARIELI